MTNILIITKNYPPQICGVGDHSFQLKQAFEKMGHRVSIYAAGGSKLEVKQFSGAIIKDLVKIIEDENIQVVFWQYVPYSYHRKGLPFWWPGIIKEIRKLPVQQFIYFHEVAIRVSGHGTRQAIAGSLQLYIARAAMRWADAGFTSIPFYKNYFRNHKVEVVPVGSNIPENKKGIQKVTGRIICFSNRADAALIKAIQMLLVIHPEVNLVLCGAVSDKYHSYLKDLIEQHSAGHRCTITGTLSPETFGDLLASAEIYIQPQLIEGKYEGGISAKSGAVIAAMQAGLPIVSCKGDMTDKKFFRENENIFFVSYGDPGDYYHALENLLNDPAKRIAAGAAARKTFETYASWEKISTSFASHFKRPGHLPTIHKPIETGSDN